MRIASIASAVLALGVSAVVPSMAKADHFRGRDFDRRYDDRRVVVERRVIEPPVVREIYRGDVYRDIDVTVSLRDVPSSVRNALDCERHGPVETVQFVRRNGQEFYRFGVDERRGAQTIIRIGSNGRLLTIGEQQDCDPGYAVYRR